MNSKIGTTSWEDLRLFLAVAQEGGLASAANAANSSAPTLNRRIRNLEITLGVALFDRHRNGYDLTLHGRQLLDRVLGMDTLSKAIQTWREELDQRPIVRIAAGAWTSVFLARHMNVISNRTDNTCIEILTGANFLNLSRHEADIGIRNRSPDQQGLARKRIGPVDFAVYGSVAYSESSSEAFSEQRYAECDWVAMSESGGTGTSSHWLKQRMDGAAKLICATPHSMLEAVAAGTGLCILPCFIGSADQRLRQCSAPLEALRHTQWLASHDASRNLPHIRSVSRRIVRLYKEHQSLIG